MKSTTLHGGNIYRAGEELGIPEDKIIDFSANINPLGMPKDVIKEIERNLKYLSNYPDPDAKTLRFEIAKYHTISSESIVCGNGSTELIYLIVRALKPKNVLVPAPTFSEYERACKSYGARIINYGLKKENNFDIDTDEFIGVMKRGLCDMAFLCNPNNPTGRLIQKKDVLRIARAAKALKSYLIVDEAFIDFIPDASVIREVEKNPYLIVIRSMTKFYALAGLRLGYGIFPLKIIDLIKQHKEPWTVNTLAQKAGIIALRDVSYKNATYILIDREKRFLENNFRKAGIRFFHSCANFYLLKISNSEPIYRELKKKDILVRLCFDFKGLDKTYIRVAVRTREENIRLIKELSQ
jgi:threonine-phosphate decarboxylase